MLARLGWWSAGPLLLLAAVLAGLRLHQIDRATAEQATALATDVAMAIDRSLYARLRGLALLARLTDAHQMVDGASMYRHALAFEQAYGNHVMFVSPTGAVLLNTRAPLGATLPGLPADERWRAARDRLARGDPVVTDLVQGRLAGQRLVAIAVPVQSSGRLQGTWVAQYEAAAFEGLLQEHTLPAGWRLLLRDGTGAVMASRGQPAADTPGDDSPQRASHALQRAAWRLEVEVPASQARRPVVQAAIVLLLGAALATATGVLGSRVIGRRIDRALRGLADERAGPPPAASAITEIAQVQARLADAARARDAAQEALRQSALAYRLMFDHHPQPMWVYDQESLRFLAVNDAATAAYGYGRDEFLTMTLADIRPPEELPRMLASVAEYARGGHRGQRPAEVWRHRARDGREILVEIHSRALAFGDRPGRLVMAQDVTERLRAERALRDSERDFRLLAEQVPAIVYRARLDPPGKTDYVSPRIRELGYTPEQWVAGQPALFCEAIHPDDLPRFRSQAMAALSGPLDEFQLEYRLRDGCGRWRHVSDRARIVRPTDGSAPFILGLQLDTTPQREAELSLRRSEQKFRTLAEQLPAIVYQASPDGRGPITYISPGIGRLGYAPEALVGPGAISWWDLMHPDDRPRIAAEVARQPDAAQPVDRQLAYRLRHRQGDWRHVIDYARVGTDADGTPMVQGVVVDTTVLKRSEEALRAAEAYLRSVFDSLAEGVLLLDQTQRVLDVNPAAAAMLGYETHELLGRSLQELLAPADAHRTPEIAALLAAPGQASFLEWGLRHRGGREFTVEVSARAIDGERHVQVWRDITERREAQRQLMAHQAALSELAQQLMAQERATTHRLAQALHDQLGQSLAVARLHLDTTLILMAGQMPATLKPACQRVSEAVNEAIAVVRQVLVELRPPLLEQRGLLAALDNEVRIRTVPGGPVDLLLEADEGLAAQRWPGEVEYGAFMIAREAIVNALRHAGASLVRVIVEGDARALHLAVQDDGRGMNPALEHGRPGHLGLVGMRERALAIGARFSIGAVPEGGTRVQLDWQNNTE